ncbi:response regulator transcription factor [Conexibacter sp. SYSU D00693]|uniref:response regulator n=1 Tax=Conexibacter sp. SYSU D00693 TaxID=2812560 RepID=UPI00196AD7EA|nr:response regulator transcription factor [Conexibacter sp. SYSU D00693]
MKTERVTVVVADDHPLFRDAVSAALKRRPEFDLVGAYADGRQALDAIREHRPAVAVLDVQMPELSGHDVLNAVRRDELGTRVVLLSANLDSDSVYQAIANGASAYLSKDATQERVCDAVMSVARGDVVLSAEVQTGLATEVQARAAAGRTLLSPREQEILALTASGMSAPDIGRQLHLSPATVKTHLKSLYEKLGVSDRAAAVAEGMRRGLLE